MNTRFQARLDGFGWPAIWDTAAACFLPGRFDTLPKAAERAEILNDGRAPVATSAAPPPSKKPKPPVDEPTLFDL